MAQYETPLMSVFTKHFFNSFTIELSLSLIFKNSHGVNNDHKDLKIFNGFNGNLLPEDGVMLRNVVNNKVVIF